MKLTFCGGVKQVTGANYLLEGDSSPASAGSERPVRILIDCGLHQGSNFSEKENWEPFLYDPKTIDAVFITHAHIDHVGRLPSLVKAGFKGKIYSVMPTRDAAELLLLDSDHILEQTAEQFKKPILFNEEDVAQVMKLWEGVEYYKPVILDNLKIIFYNAGHILGSAFILVEELNKEVATVASSDLAMTKIGRPVKVVFSGDLGNSPSPILGDKDNLPETDYCLIESTYGDRLHEDLSKRKDMLEDVIEEAAKKKGTLIIPAFAMERTQELIFELDELVSQGRIPRLQVYIDSPLAIKLIKVYQKYKNYLSVVIHFNYSWIKTTLTTEESKKINEVPPPKIVVAGSGMSHGGRILFHEKFYLPGEQNTMLIIGYQAKGSLGRQILDGAQTVKIHGEEVAVRATIKNIAGYSAHADQAQLLQWLKPQRISLKKVFVVQGEEEASNVLSGKIRDELAIEAEVPEAGVAYELT